ncbi:hypothetical protein KKE19_01910 [Patescibacteria group bacterium]|nr:hypothetical protein [Patescibacteria group bacterium]MBU4274548.1 hypothetical protein [Patescibacteria group bacterium]MBU4367453.1 hypothetical protein [Patescibacteria group bacterium]MBU4461773.1 hypothetical protein [Patescibacteria group bacterium]MCG2700157.1 hypothetical protein [Candidatus Parcubacteria bacterium]
MSKKIIILLTVIVIGLVLVGYWYYNNQIFSKGIMKLEILGPDSVQMGEEFTYTVRYKNNSDFTLEDPKLIFEYPEYSVGEDGKNRVTQVLQDIYPGDERLVQFKARLFGKENDLKTAKTGLSYRPKNLTAYYESETTFTTKIDLVPLSLDFDLPSKLEAGREIEFSLNYFSNMDYNLSELRITIGYPEKFEFLRSDPKTLENNEWEISNLKKVEGGRIKINGRSTAEAGERIKFEANLGIWQDGDFLLLKEVSKEVEIIEPLLYISQQINGSVNYVASPGEKLHYEIYFRNIGDTSFENLYLINKLDGLAFDLSSIEIDSDQARVDDNLIIWDWKQASNLRHLDVQKESKVEFNVKLNDMWQVSDAQLNNTIIKNRVNIDSITQEFQTKVNSRLVVSQKGSRQDSGIYTIEWQVKNLYNDVKNVKVRATLPSWINLTGMLSPEDQISNFSFDNTSREIIWSVADDLEASAGVSTMAPTVLFQISLIDPSQAGGAITLINKPRITGEDQWTGRNIVWEGQAMDTTLLNSQNANPSEEE